MLSVPLRSVGDAFAHMFEHRLSVGLIYQKYVDSRAGISLCSSLLYQFEKIAIGAKEKV